MKTARAFLGTQADATAEESVWRAMVSRRRSVGAAFGLRVAVLVCFGVVACNVYDETLLPIGPAVGGGGIAGTGGATGAGTGGGAGGSAGTGGNAGDGAAPQPDSSQGGSTGGFGGTGGGGSMTVPDGTVAPDVAKDAIADRVDVSVIPMCRLLIDDMESGTGHAFDNLNCRNGYWFSYSDNAAIGTQTPLPASTFSPSMPSPPRVTGDLYAARTFGSGHTYAGMGLNLNNPPGSAVPGLYDASAYIGVSFWAMGSGGSITLMVPDRDTEQRGGVCMTADRGRCFDHYGSAPRTITATWQFYTVLFSELVQQGFGYRPPGFDKSAIYAIQWQVNTPASGPFDFWIDDVSFVTPAGDASTQ
jgi:hypothetical protein